MHIIVTESFKFEMFGAPRKILAIIKYLQINQEDSFINTKSPSYVICKTHVSSMIGQPVCG